MKARREARRCSNEWAGSGAANQIARPPREEHDASTKRLLSAVRRELKRVEGLMEVALRHTREAERDLLNVRRQIADNKAQVAEFRALVRRILNKGI